MDFIAGNTQAMQPAVFAQLKLNDLVPDTGHSQLTASGPDQPSLADGRTSAIGIGLSEQAIGRAGNGDGVPAKLIGEGSQARSACVKACRKFVQGRLIVFTGRGQ